MQTKTTCRQNVFFLKFFHSMKYEKIISLMKFHACCLKQTEKIPLYKSLNFHFLLMVNSIHTLFDVALCFNLFPNDLWFGKHYLLYAFFIQ